MRGLTAVGVRWSPGKIQESRQLQNTNEKYKYKIQIRAFDARSNGGRCKMIPRQGNPPFCLLSPTGIYPLRLGNHQTMMMMTNNVERTDPIYYIYPAYILYCSPRPPQQSCATKDCDNDENIDYSFHLQPAFTLIRSPTKTKMMMACNVDDWKEHERSVFIGQKIRNNWTIWAFSQTRSKN